MKLRLNILHTEASPGWGGQEIRIITEVQGMVERGHQVMIAAPPHANILKDAKEKGIPVAEADFNHWGFVHGIRTVLRLIREHSIDVVNTHSSRDSWIAGIAGRLSKNSSLVVRTRHLDISIGKDSFSRALYRRIPHFIITTGEPIKQMIVRGLKFPEDKVESVPTGIDLNRFEPSRRYDDVRPEYGIPPDGFVIGTIAVLRSWKGHKFLLEAARQLCAVRSDMWFLIVGDGPGWERYNRWVKDHGLDKRVLLTGYQQRVPEILHSIDLFVLPSYAFEGIPQALIQAMAMKKPVVTCNVGGIGEVVVDRETGRFTPTKEPYALANTIAELREDAPQRKRLAQAGFTVVRRKFGIEKMLDKTEEIYFRALSAVRKG